MANEILPAGIGDLITTQAMAAEFLMLLSDKDGSILNHPALLHATAPNLTSNVVRVSHVGIGYDLLSATTPGSEVANNAYSDGSTDVTIAMRALRRNADDLARVMAGDKINPVLFAQDAAISVAQTLISLLANVGDDFSATVGTSGADATWDDIIDGKTTLGVLKVGGPLISILHPQQWGDLEKDALSMGALPAMTMAGVINQGLGQSYKGRYMGCDFFTSSHVPTADAGANRAGCMFGPGGLVWADAMIETDGDPNIVNLGRARFERVRKGDYLATSWITSFACGVAKALEAGVTIKTDA